MLGAPCSINQCLVKVDSVLVKATKEIDEKIPKLKDHQVVKNR